MCLPQSVLTRLGEVEHGDPRAVASRADRLGASYGKQKQEITVLEAKEEGVAAIRGQGSSARLKNK
jgi:hypothetical protein